MPLNIVSRQKNDYAGGGVEVHDYDNTVCSESIFPKEPFVSDVIARHFNKVQSRNLRRYSQCTKS